MSSVEEVVKLIDGLDKASCGNKTERVMLQLALARANRRLQSPWDVAYEHCWEAPATAGSLDTLTEVGLWDEWVKAGAKPSTPEELSKLVPMDAVLLNRFLRMIAAVGLLKQSDDGLTYSLTDYGIAMGSSDLRCTYLYRKHLLAPLADHAPTWLAKRQYRNPGVASEGTNARSMVGDDFFDWIMKHPEKKDIFERQMKLFSNYKEPLSEVYPTESIVKSAKPGVPIFVDVGGGLGHDIESFSAAHPDLDEGSLVLQDLPQVLESAQVSSSIVKCPIDFLKGQPIHGARVYYLHMILHDWPDAEAITILKHIASVMERGYSKVLVHENLVKARNPHPRTTMMDVGMMIHFSAAEREEAAWVSIAEAAGLRIVKIWESHASVESLIELDLA